MDALVKIVAIYVTVVLLVLLFDVVRSLRGLEKYGAEYEHVWFIPIWRYFFITIPALGIMAILTLIKILRGG